MFGFDTLILGYSLFKKSKSSIPTYAQAWDYYWFDIVPFFTVPRVAKIILAFNEVTSQIIKCSVVQPATSCSTKHTNSPFLHFSTFTGCSSCMSYCSGRDFCIQPWPRLIRALRPLRHASRQSVTTNVISMLLFIDMLVRIAKVFDVSVDLPCGGRTSHTL